jgi:hypothetical protein
MTRSPTFRWRPRSVPLLFLLGSLEQSFCLEARPILLLDAFRDGEAVYANLQWLCSILRSCRYRTFRWSTPSLENGVPRPTCDHPAT